jgi:hypothetical protein
MPRESWEIAHDSYYDDLEAEDYEGLDDISAWKEEEQKVIDELCKRMEKAYDDDR